MNPLYSVAEIRAIEHSAAAALPAGVLMRRAGQAAANAALDLLPCAPAHAKVLVLAGPGDNGGDALEAAAHLSCTGARVTVIHYAPQGACSAERAAALERAQASEARFRSAADADLAGTEWSLVVDGLFGIGLKRPLTGGLREVALAVNASRRQVLALDVPSGLDADTGAVVGADSAPGGGVAIHATRTVTFIGDKPGLHTCDGRDYAGVVEVARLEIDAAHFAPARLHLNEVKFFARHSSARRHNTHKGSYGTVAVIGGAPGMSGAPVLAARAALNSGAGRVHVLFAGEPLRCDPGQPELMCRAADGFDLGLATLVIGPGLGAAAHAVALLRRAIDTDGALLADADALNLVAADAALQSALAARSVVAVLTPHPLEAARLLGVGIGAVQADRVGAARTLAARLRSVVVLKGSGTVIAAPDGDAVINTTGNPALATAGTGDVLAGLCGGLLAQGWPQWEAALAAVWLHGMAADMLVAEGAGPIGLTAGELIPAIRIALNRMSVGSLGSLGVSSLGVSADIRTRALP